MVRGYTSDFIGHPHLKILYPPMRPPTTPGPPPFKSGAGLSYRVQVLCANKLPLYFRKFLQHEKFDCNFRCSSEVQSMLGLVQINFLKSLYEINELRHVKLYFWCYEYDYKCNSYSLVTTTVAVKQLYVTSQKDFTFLNLMYQAISALVYTVRKLKCGLHGWSYDIFHEEW